VRNNEFDHANLALGINEAHAQGKQFYVVVNIAPHNAKLKTFPQGSGTGGGDGAGCADHVRPGADHAGARALPAHAIHLSVQANAVNWASVEFWRSRA
jgi:U32 family peptidase